MPAGIPDTLHSAARPAYPRNLQKGLLSGVVIALALVTGGRFLAPAMSWLSTISVWGVLLAYGGLAAFWPIWLHQRHPGILVNAIFFGLLAGLVFAAEIILEYILLPADNSRYGLIEFGAVFLLYLASAFLAAFRSRSIWNGVWASVACAFIASLVWVIATLAVFYAFRGSPRQIMVLRAEGDYEDFARSGMNDFNAFIMEDFMGAAFFHLSLGLLVAAALGGLGGLLGKICAMMNRRQKSII